MQYLENEDKRVSVFWSYPKEKIDNDTSNSIKTIVSFREKLLSMVHKKLLTMDDYNDMKRVFCKASVGKFFNCIFVAEIMFLMKEEDILHEIANLIENGFLSDNITKKSKASQIANLIVEIQGRIFALAYNSLYSLIPSGEDKISYLKKLSDYSDKCINEDTLIEFYNEWVNKSFKDEQLKIFLLDNHESFIKIVRILALQNLKKELASVEDVTTTYTKQKYAKNYYKIIAKNKW